MEIPTNLEEVSARLQRAARRVGRDPAGITILGVTKTVPAERIEEAYAAGLRHFGENRWQEAESKLDRLRLPGSEWHFIGRLQANKLARVMEKFDWVQSFCDLDLIEKADRHLARIGERRNALLQVNISGEASKGGWTYEGIRDFLSDPVAGRFPRLIFRGLMGIGPLAPAARIRESFRRFHGLYEETKRVQKSFDTLSLGMSGDFEIAVEEGSTMIRVGSSIFGERS